MLNGRKAGSEHPHFVDGILARRLHETNVLPGPERPVHDADVADHAAVVVINGVEDQRLERGVRVPLRGGDPLNDALKDIVHPAAVLCAGQNGVPSLQPHNILDLLLRVVRPGGGKVDFIDDGQNLKPLLYRLVGIGHCLGLDSLAGVHHQQRPLAGRQ